MKFRLKAFGLHLLASTVVLSLIYGAFYLGWYKWPGWYLADVKQVALVMAGVDLVLGPLLTLVIASASKPRRELQRDIAMIVVVQLCALGYGCASMWNGRPLYYAYSETVLSVVQAYDIDSKEAALAVGQNPALAAHWYSLPRWVWAPLPEDPNTSSKIMQSAITGGDDVTSMPRYFKPWSAGTTALRAQLKSVQDIGFFAAAEKNSLKQRLHEAGIDPAQKNGLPFTGRGHPLLAVFEPTTGKMIGIFKP